jgi:hypothetical protein
MPCSQLFPGGQCHQFVEDCLQSLKATFVIPGCALYAQAQIRAEHDQQNTTVEPKFL